jgi:AraC-like DNA-binding protein
LPLFIDLHIDGNLTPDLVKQCHVADKSIQAKYGVKYLQILLNQPQGYLFCLVEGPDKESCAQVHQEAHGNIACNILEITESDFSALLANKAKDGKDFTLNQDGTLDTGNRAILALNLLSTPENYRLAKEIVNEVIQQTGGRNVESFGNRLVAIFDSPSSAVDSGIIILQKIANSAIPVEVRMGADVGPPLGEKGIFFEEALKSADRFSFISMSGQITVSTKIRQLYSGDMKMIANPVKVISLPDEKFLARVMDCTETVWDKNDMTITDFSRKLGMSKSQLVRRLKSLTSLSPNDFLKEFRLRKAIHLIEDQTMNIAEITMTIGFSNPSYFTKCFRKRFGTAPSDYLHFQAK